MDLQGYRTLIFGLLIAIVPAVSQYILSINWVNYVPGPYVPLVSGVVGVLIVYLRSITNTPMGSK